MNSVEAEKIKRLKRTIAGIDKQLLKTVMGKAVEARLMEQRERAFRKLLELEQPQAHPGLR